ncbi:MAG TPA: cyanophycin synthetase, partial [Candidatus Omnitrophota bacterium]|nr:cyanophycin synthetase [Candidatus Omnitrophota bacterium]
ATAIAAVEVLNECGIEIKEDAIVKGIAGARWEGRVEVAGHKPYVILDGAQNRSSAEALANTIRKIFRYRKLYLILGVSKDKDIKGILEELLPLSDEVLLTKANIPDRAMEPARIREFMGSKVLAVDTGSVSEAVARALDMAREEDMILVTGSLFVVGEARALLVR